MKLRQNFELFMFCILIGIGIVYLRLFASYPENVVSIIKGIGVLANYYINLLDLTIIENVLEVLSTNQLFFVLVLLQIVFGAVLLKLFGEKFVRGVNIVCSNLYRVIRWGVLWYGLVVVSMVVFFLSVAGISIAGLFLAFLAVVTVIGSVSIAVTVGNSVRKMLNVKNNNIFVLYMLGEFVITLCSSVGVLSGVITIFIMPVLSLGTVWCYIMDRFIYKGYPERFDGDDEDTNKFDRNHIRDIITNGVKS